MNGVSLIVGWQNDYVVPIESTLLHLLRKVLRSSVEDSNLFSKELLIWCQESDRTLNYMHNLSLSRTLFGCEEQHFVQCFLPKPEVMIEKNKAQSERVTKGFDVRTLEFLSYQFDSNTRKNLMYLSKWHVSAHSPTMLSLCQEGKKELFLYWASSMCLLGAFL